MSGAEAGGPLGPFEGRAWVLGDQIDTDVLAPGAYMLESIEGLARHCLEAVRPDFAGGVEPGDMIVAGRSFGIGSSREQAVLALKHLGVRAIVARSFARIFYRNGIALGMPVMTCPEAHRIDDGERIRLEVAGANLTRLDAGETLACEVLPAFLLEQLADGGLIPHLKRVGLDRRR